MSTQLAKEESATGIPVVDLGGFYSGGQAERRRTAATLRAALESLGFCYLRNHGVPTAVVEALSKQSQAFFALPLEVKQGLKRTSKGRLTVRCTYCGCDLCPATQPWKAQAVQRG